MKHTILALTTVFLVGCSGIVDRTAEPPPASAESDAPAGIRIGLSSMLGNTPFMTPPDEDGTDALCRVRPQERQPDSTRAATTFIA